MHFHEYKQAIIESRLITPSLRNDRPALNEAAVELQRAVEDDGELLPVAVERIVKEYTQFDEQV